MRLTAADTATTETATATDTMITTRRAIKRSVWGDTDEAGTEILVNGHARTFVPDGRPKGYRVADEIARIRNEPCPRCETHCHGDCTA